MSILKINGAERDFPEGLPATLTALLEELDVNAATVVAEVDGQIVPREQFNETSLSDGQQIELVRFCRRWIMTKPSQLAIAGRTFASRLMVGTGSSVRMP